MAPEVFGTRVGRIDLGFVALLVLGHDGVDAAGDRIGLDVLRPVHRGRAEGIRRQPCLQQHLGLVGKAVVRRELALAVNQRQPGHRAIGVVTGDRQHAIVKKAVAGSRIRLVVGLVRDVAVHVFEIVVVAHVDDDAAVLVEDDGRRLMRHAPEGRALHRLRLGIIRVDLDHPIEAVRLVRFLVDVEAVMETAAP